MSPSKIIALTALTALALGCRRDMGTAEPSEVEEVEVEADEKGPFEGAGEELDESIENAEDEDDAEDAAEEAAEEIDEAVEEAEDEIDD